MSAALTSNKSNDFGHDAGRYWPAQNHADLRKMHDRLADRRLCEALRPKEIAMTVLFVMRCVKADLAKCRRGFPYAAETLPHDLVVRPAVHDNGFGEAATDASAKDTELTKTDLPPGEPPKGSPFESSSAPGMDEPGQKRNAQPGELPPRKPMAAAPQAVSPLDVASQDAPPPATPPAPKRGRRAKASKPI